MTSLPMRGRLNFDLTSHPLRRPSEYLRTYERIWESCREVKPTLLGQKG